MVSIKEALPQKKRDLVRQRSLREQKVSALVTVFLGSMSCFDRFTFRFL